MKCPVCNVNLLISERQGVEIDYCPECRGIWLDRGELEKLIERSGSYEQPRRDSYREDSRSGHRHEDQHHGEHHHDEYRNEHGHGDYKNRKKESFLTDLFDF